MRRPPGSARLDTRCPQPVADVAHRLDRIRRVRVTQLAPQVADVDLEHLRAGIEVEPPDRVEDLLAGENLVGVAHQVGEQLELARGQLDLVAVALDPPRAQVEADVGDVEHGGFMLAGARSCARTRAKSSSNANGLVT